MLWPASSIVNEFPTTFDLIAPQQQHIYRRGYSNVHLDIIVIIIIINVIKWQQNDYREKQHKNNLTRDTKSKVSKQLNNHWNGKIIKKIIAIIYY